MKNRRNIQKQGTRKNTLEICYKYVKCRLTRTDFFSIIWNIKKRSPVRNPFY